MHKLWTLALKEVKLAFRDVGAIVTMLVTPLVLTLAIGAAFGTGDGVLPDIPVLLLNRDRQEMSRIVEEALTSEELEDLLAPELVTDEGDARARVEGDDVAALVIIPPGFSDRVVPVVGRVREALGIDLVSLDVEAADPLPAEVWDEIGRLYLETREMDADPVVVEIYASPNWRISAGVIRGIVTQVLERMNVTTQGMSIIMEELIARGALGPGGEERGVEVIRGVVNDGFEGVVAGELPVRVEIVSPSGRGFRWVDYSATSMAVLFLMFAVTSGGRTLLAERQGGTLPRLLVSPTPALTILGGKMSGIFVTGLMQVFALWGATTLIGAYWGAPLGVVAAIVVLVLCASGVGALISAWAQNASQAGTIGTAVTLVGSAVSGTFFPRGNLPAWVQNLSLVTPNAWGIEIFSALQMGRGLVGILPLLGGALSLTVLYYFAALIGFRRQLK